MIIGDQHTARIHPYKGIGRIPKDMRDAPDPGKRILLTNLPKLLRGYGRAFQGYPPECPATVVVVCDLDNKDGRTFLRELKGIFDKINPKPNTRFCLAIEEGEAWLLGDLDAVRMAYPDAKASILEAYVNDSICGTWETLASAVYPGGERSLSSQGWQAVGAEKSRWAEKIPPFMDVENNASPSFCGFRDSIRKVLAAVAVS